MFFTSRIDFGAKFVYICQIYTLSMKKLISLSLLVLAMLAGPVHVYADDVVADSVAAQSDLPVVTPYFMHHQFLSVVAPKIDLDDAQLLASPTILNSISPEGNGFRSPFADSDIEVTPITDGDLQIFVWRFPEPQHDREALYMAFIPVDGHYIAYAISPGKRVDWEISTSTSKSRGTYGRVKRPESAQECYDLLKARGALTGKITPGDFIQEGYRSLDADADYD